MEQRGTASQNAQEKLEFIGNIIGLVIDAEIKKIAIPQRTSSLINDYSVVIKDQKAKINAETREALNDIATYAYVEQKKFIVSLLNIIDGISEIRGIVQGDTISSIVQNTYNYLKEIDPKIYQISEYAKYQEFNVFQHAIMNLTSRLSDLLPADKHIRNDDTKIICCLLEALKKELDIHVEHFLGQQTQLDAALRDRDSQQQMIQGSESMAGGAGESFTAESVPLMNRQSIEFIMNHLIKYEILRKEEIDLRDDKRLALLAEIEAEQTKLFSNKDCPEIIKTALDRKNSAFYHSYEPVGIDKSKIISDAETQRDLVNTISVNYYNSEVFQPLYTLRDASIYVYEQNVLAGKQYQEHEPIYLAILHDLNVAMNKYIKDLGLPTVDLEANKEEMLQTATLRGMYQYTASFSMMMYQRRAIKGQVEHQLKK